MSNEAPAEVTGAILEPDLPIVDGHMHLFDHPGNCYLLEDYLADAQGGHNVIASVYCETQTFSRPTGPPVMRPLGEVEFANGIAAMTATGRYGPCRVAAGIIGHADMTFGAQVGALLDRCLAVAPDRYRGVRQVTLDYPDERPFQFIMTRRPPQGLLDHPEFANGLAELERRGLIYDAAIYDPSLPRITELADRLPGLTMVIDHMGSPVGVDMSDEDRREVFRRWSANLRNISERPNVLCKISGLGMPTAGFGFQKRDTPPEYIELAEAWRPFVETAIEHFGIARCIFGSNFPPDRRSAGFTASLNAYKHIVRNYSSDEKNALFAGNAIRTYRLDQLDP